MNKKQDLKPSKRRNAKGGLRNSTITLENRFGIFYYILDNKISAAT